MTARQTLEVLGEGDVDRCAADRPDDWDSLRRGFLRDDDSKTRPNRADQTRKRRRRLAGNLPDSQKARRVRHGFREHGAQRKIAALKNVSLGGVSAQREYLQAGESRARLTHVFSLRLRDFRDRAQHDRRRHRQFDRQARKPDGAADAAGERRETTVNPHRVLLWLRIEARQRHFHRCGERFLRGGRRRRLQTRRQCQRAEA